MNLRELSELLNLSQTTVSRALNGYPEVNEATRKRVLDAADAHNYRPNARARSLATGRSMSIGHVLPTALHSQMANIIFSEFVTGAGEIYGQHGYDMVVSVVSDADEMQAYRDLAGRQSVDGVIVHSPRINDPRIPLLSQLNLPFVVHGRSTEATVDYSWLDVNNRRAIERATRYLIELGHERIGLINGDEAMDFAWRRRAGYRAALSDAGIAERADYITNGEMTEPYGYDSARRMLESVEPPTAFVCSSIVSTLGIRRAVDDLGLRIGRDVSVVSYDDAIAALPNGGAADPTYTATRSSVRAAGRRCAELLMERIQTPQMPFKQELWEAELLLGRSTAIAPRVSQTG